MAIVNTDGHIYIYIVTLLKMYGKGIKIDEIREFTTIDTSFDISRVIVVIALIFLEHMWHTIDYSCAKCR